MQEKKYYMAIDEYERRMIINSLHNLPGKRIME